MRNLIIAGLLVSGMAAGSPSLAQTSAEEVAQLKQRVTQLERQVEEISQWLQPLKAQQAAEDRRKALRERFEKKMARDRQKYTQEQLREAESLYQVANQKWGTPEAQESLRIMIQRYPDINRTGCATLYVAQKSKGDERAKYLKECIENFNDCYYGDGVQVGAYARFLLAGDYVSRGEQEEAAALYNEIQAKYSDAVDHSGKLLVDTIKATSK